MNPDRGYAGGSIIRVMSASTEPNLNLACALLLEHHGLRVAALQSKAEALKEIESTEAVSPYQIIVRLC